MEPSKQISKQGVIYNTGATRSGDAEATRYDLVSPIAVARMVSFYARHSLEPRNDISGTLDMCLAYVYKFLSGRRDLPLEWATAHLFVAMEQDFGFDSLSLASLSPHGLEAIAEACYEGAAKYSDYNWERGMPVSDLLNHCIRHIVMFKLGDETEPHLGHAAWNLFAAMHSEDLWGHLNGNLRGDNCTPPARAEK